MVQNRNCSLLSLLALNTLKGDIRCVISDIDRIYILPIVMKILYNKLFQHQKRKVKLTISN